MSLGGRTALAAMAVLSLASPLEAQNSGMAGSPGGCGPDNRVLRSALGASSGAIVGLVAVNIRYSDWSDRQPRNLGMIRLNASVLGGLLGASVGSIRFGGCQPGPSSRQRARGMYAAITADEIERSGLNGSVYELVHSLRRPWLNTRGIEMSETPTVTGDPRSGVSVTPGNPTIMVYLDHAKLGDMVALTTIPVVGVTSVRYYDAAEATQKWGMGHNHGAIEVLTTASSAPNSRIAPER